MNLDELLPLYALGALDPDEVATVDRAVAADPALAARLAQLQAETAELADALPGVAPSPAVKARLLGSTQSRFDAFVDRFARMFNVGVARARELLDLIDSPTAWQPGPAPGAWLIHFTAGPALAGVDTGFVRLEPGATFAWHRHDGDELNLVLAGAATDTLAGPLGVGDSAFAAAGTQHDFTTVGDEPLIFAVWVRGVDFTATRPPG